MSSKGQFLMSLDSAAAPLAGAALHLAAAARLSGDGGDRGSWFRQSQRRRGRGGGTPLLQLAGFHGPLDVLLALARSRQIALAHLSAGDLVDQFVTAVQQADPRIPLSRKGDWLVMAAWLLWLRSRLLLPLETPARGEARDD